MKQLNLMSSKAFLVTIYVMTLGCGSPEDANSIKPLVIRADSVKPKPEQEPSEPSVELPAPSVFMSFDSDLLEDLQGTTSTLNTDNLPLFTAGKKKKGVSFDGEDDRIELDLDTARFGGDQNFSMATWFRSDSTRPTGQIINGQVENNRGNYFLGGTGYHYGLTFLQNREGQRFIGHIYWCADLDNENNRQARRVNFSDNLEISKWYHIASVFNAETQTAQLFVDGKMIETATLDFTDCGGLKRIRDGSPPDENVSTFTIGGMDNMWRSEASLDEVKIWSEALTPEQVSLDYQSSVGP